METTIAAEITSDGHTVWVNGGYCLARFTVAAAEFFPSDFIPSCSFKDFQKECLSRLGVIVEDKHKPKGA